MSDGFHQNQSLKEFENIKLGFEHFSVDRVILAFEKLITPERLQKIETVVNQRSSSLIPVLENIYDRGNISAVMRSAEAFGFHHFHIIEQGSNFKESNRVTQGADKWLQVQKWKSTTKAFEYLKSNGVKIFTTSLTERAVDIDELDLAGPTALVLGNEKDGVSKEALDHCDGNVLIPMRGFTQSFNISVAAALCFYSLSRKAKPIDEAERKHLKAQYILNSLQHSQDRILKVLNSTF